MRATKWRVSVMVAAFAVAALLAALGAATWARQTTGGQAQQTPTGRIHGTVKDKQAARL